jgi:DNA-directed RNA polymerase specialized sigma24 family protein
MKQIKALWDEIDADETSLDRRKWLLAEALAEQADEGMTTRQIADKTGRSQTTVNRWVTTWRSWSESRGTRTFNECYYEVRSGSSQEEHSAKTSKQRTISEAKKFLAEAPAEEVERVLLSLPNERRAELARSVEEAHPARTVRPMPEAINPPKSSLFFAMGPAFIKIGDGIAKFRQVWDDQALDASEEERDLAFQELEGCRDMIQDQLDRCTEQMEG